MQRRPPTDPPPPAGHEPPRRAGTDPPYRAITAEGTGEVPAGGTPREVIADAKSRDAKPRAVTAEGTPRPFAAVNPFSALDGGVVEAIPLLDEEEGGRGDTARWTREADPEETERNTLLGSRTTRRDMQAVEPREPAAISVVASAVVLVVDRDRELLRGLRAIGRQHLVEVLPAVDAAEALQLARSGRLDAAVLAVDPAAPEEALRLATALRSRPEHATLPIAVMSADPQLAGRVAAAHAGASLFLVKPIEPDTFAAAVQQLAAMGRADRPRIVVVDDDVLFCGEVAAILHGRGMTVTSLHEPANILAELERARPDLLLLDHELPGVSGLELCRTLRAMPRWQDLPILFVTGRSEVGSQLAAFAAGADDYLIKPVATDELLARIQVRVDRARLLRERADKDMLTGLPLRRPFMEALAARMAEGQRHQRSLTLCILDLDRFKQVNDVYGHLAGDRALASLGQLLASRFRKEDLRARWGGEEFALAFPGEIVSTVYGVLGKVLNEFSAIRFIGDDGQRFHVTFSAGTACFPDDGLSAHALLSAADRRLRRAKLAGRSTILCVG